MLFFVRYRLKEERLKELAEAVRSGEFTYKAKYVYASLNDPLVGLTIWDVPTEDMFDVIKTQLEQYADISEIMPVISAEEAQQRIFKELSQI